MVAIATTMIVMSIAMISGLVFELLVSTVEALVPESSGFSQVLSIPGLCLPGHT